MSAGDTDTVLLIMMMRDAAADDSYRDHQLVETQCVHRDNYNSAPKSTLHSHITFKYILESEEYSE